MSTIAYHNRVIDYNPPIRVSNMSLYTSGKMRLDRKSRLNQQDSKPQLDFSILNNEPHVRFSDLVFNTGQKKYYFPKVVLYQQEQKVFTNVHHR